MEVPGPRSRPVPANGRTGTRRAPAEWSCEPFIIRFPSLSRWSRALASPAFAQAKISPDETRDTNLRAYTELLRSDLRTEKVAVITEIMQFTEAEDAKFWPVYRAHETALAALNDERMKLIQDYAASFETLSDDAADRITRGALDLQARRNTELAGLLRQAASGTSRQDRRAGAAGGTSIPVDPRPADRGILAARPVTQTRLPSCTSAPLR